MKTKVEDLTDAELDRLVGKVVKGWELDDSTSVWTSKDPDESLCWYAPCAYVRSDAWWQPSENPAQFFLVDKPSEWLFDFYELMEPEDHRVLAIDIRKAKWFGDLIASVCLPLDPANKTAAYCRGRCIVALKACGVTEVDDD